MIKSELVERLARAYPNLYHRDIERAVNRIFAEITQALARGERVEIRGFGAFTVKQRDARTGRNPRTGDPVDVDAKVVPFFRAGKELRDRLNGEGGETPVPPEPNRSQPDGATARPGMAAGGTHRARVLEHEDA